MLNTAGPAPPPAMVESPTDISLAPVVPLTISDPPVILNVLPPAIRRP